jgi:GPH family glycoside/pentoside/hexuronide:cation symporter
MTAKESERHMAMNPSKVGLGEIIGYGLSGTATNLIWGTIGGFLAYFYTDVFGLSVGAMGMIFMVSRVWDMVADFLMGLVADRTQTRWGKFRPWLLWTCVPFGLITLLTFYTPALGPTGKVVYAFVTYMLLMTVYTICVVPQNSIQGVMSDDPQVRTRITSIGGVVGGLGGLISTACCLPLVKYFGQGNEAKGFQWTIGLFAVVATVLYLITFFTVRERVQPPRQQHSSVWVDVKDLLQNKPWVLIFVVGVVAALASASRVGVAVHFFKYNLGDKDLTTVIRSIGVVAGMVGGLATPLAGRWMGKARTLGLCVLVVGLSCMLLYFARADRLWVAYLSTVLTDFFGGIVITMFFAMLGDTADYNEWRYGRRATGLIYAAGSVALKTGFAFGGLIMGGVLAYYGYQANAEQSARSLFGIAMAATIVPGALFCLAALPMFFYPLNSAKLQEIKLDLERRRELAGNNDA